MELLLIIIAVFVAAIAYFCFGALIKFAWGWFPVCVAVLGTAALTWLGGLTGLIVGLLAIFASVIATYFWQDTDLFIKIEASIDRYFYFGD
jgi:hypothetical protein